MAASTLIRSIGSASQRQSSRNHTHSLLVNYTRTLTAREVNEFNFSYSTFSNVTAPVTPGPQLTFPSIQDGASFRVPQQTKQRRLQFSDTFTTIRGNHTLNFGGEWQNVHSGFNLGVFQQGRIELIEDFPDFDRNGDGRVDVVVSRIGERAAVFRNTSATRNHYLAVRLRGRRSNRDGIGARVQVTTKSGVQYNHMTTSVGYASSSAWGVHFGLDDVAVVPRIEIRWPSGTVQTLRDVRADQVLSVNEPD